MGGKCRILTSSFAKEAQAGPKILEHIFLEMHLQYKFQSFLTIEKSIEIFVIFFQRKVLKEHRLQLK